MQLCLFSHTFAGVLRFCEATEMIRKLLEEFAKDDSIDDFHSCSGESDCCSTASGFDSASEGWPEDREDAWEADSDLDALPAMPCEEEVGPPAWKGTKGLPLGRRVKFIGDHESVCDASADIDYALVDGTWRYSDLLDERVKNTLRAIARARRQRCDIVSDMQVLERPVLRDVHPCILFRGKRMC